MAKKIMLPDEVIISKIYLIRGQRVMIDRDLSELYRVETRALKQAVRRNSKRFPKDFMFAMSTKEFRDWRKEHISSADDKQGLRYAPFCFTEQGVTMLSCILNSDMAIKVNIQVIRIFTRLREMILNHKDILLKLEQLEKKTDKNEHDIHVIFDYLKELFNPKTPMRRIGFEQQKATSK